MVNEHEITKQAYENANHVVESAQDHAREIRIGANQYADGILHSIEEQLIATVETIRENRKDLKHWYITKFKKQRSLQMMDSCAAFLICLLLFHTKLLVI